MNRSLYKGPYIEASLVRKIKRLQLKGIDFSKNSIKTYSRRSQIIPSFVGKIFEIHNGHRFIRVYITENMIGHKLGEFSPTRVFAKHTSDKKNQVIQKKPKRK